MRKWWSGMVLCGAAGCLAGCVMGPDFQAPAAPRTDSFGVSAVADAAGGGAPARWWEGFGCEALDAAVEEALTNSPTLEQAKARLRRAREEHDAQAGATRWPAADAGVSAARKRVNPAAMGMSEVAAPDPFALYGASVSVSYAFDLFGGDRRALEGLKAQVDRRGWELEAARQALAANVVLAAIRQAEVEERIRVAGEIAAARRGQVEIARRRLESGGVSAQEVSRQEMLWEQARAALPALEDSRGRVRRQQAAQLGREPAEASAEGVAWDALRPPEACPASVPSEVARRRPDIRAAEAVWHQACANVGVATANLYPQISISASLGSQETDVGDVLSGANVWSLGGELMQPIFHGGALRAKKRAAVAAYDEAAAAYRETVLRGLQEVADAMGALEADARALEAREAAAGHARAAMEIAARQVEEGGLSEAAALDERIRLLQAEDDLTRARAARHADWAALFLALGGGWESEGSGGADGGHSSR